jgi:hypothetical protein
LKLSHLPVNLAAKPFFKWSLKVNPRTRNRTSRLWWFTPVIPAFRRLRQEDREFEASLGYITASKKNKNKKRQRHGGQERERERERDQSRATLVAAERLSDILSPPFPCLKDLLGARELHRTGSDSQ